MSLLFLSLFYSIFPPFPPLQEESFPQGGGLGVLKRNCLDERMKLQQTDVIVARRCVVTRSRQRPKQARTALGHILTCMPISLYKEFPFVRDSFLKYVFFCTYPGWQGRLRRQGRLVISGAGRQDISPHRKVVGACKSDLHK